VAIRDEHLSAGFLFDRPLDDDTFDGIEVLKTRAMLAVSEDPRLQTRPPRYLAELREQNFVFIQRALKPFTLRSDHPRLHSAGLTPIIAQSGTNDSSNLSLVAAGFGLTIVPEATKARKPKSVVLVSVEDLNVVTTMELVWRRNNRLPALKNFVQILHGKSIS